MNLPVYKWLVTSAARYAASSICSVTGSRGAGQLELLAAQGEFADQHIDSVFPLAGPFHDGGDERGAVAAHGAGGGVGAGFAIQEDSAQVGIVEIGKVFGVKFAARGVVAGERFAQPAGFGHAAATPDGGLCTGGIPHQRVDVFDFLERFPAPVALAQFVDRRGEPDGKSFGEVLVGMSLGVPVGQVAHEAAAVRARRVGFGRVIGFRAAENAVPFLAPGELLGMIDGVSAFVTQQHHAPLGRSAFDLHHLAEFERLEAGMGEVERDGDGGYSLRGKPFIAQVAIGLESDAARPEFTVKLLDAWFKLAAFDSKIEIADAEGEQFLVF